MSAPIKVAAGISEARALAIQTAATSLMNGLDALEAIGGWTDGDTIPALTVRWFTTKLREDAEVCLHMSDHCQPEPEVQS